MSTLLMSLCLPPKADVPPASLPATTKQVYHFEVYYVDLREINKEKQTDPIRVFILTTSLKKDFPNGDGFGFGDPKQPRRRGFAEAAKSTVRFSDDSIPCDAHIEFSYENNEGQTIKTKAKVALTPRKKYTAVCSEDGTGMFLFRWSQKPQAQSADGGK